MMSILIGKPNDKSHPRHKTKPKPDQTSDFTNQKWVAVIVNAMYGGRPTQKDKQTKHYMNGQQPLQQQPNKLNPFT